MPVVPAVVVGGAPLPLIEVPARQQVRLRLAPHPVPRIVVRLHLTGAQRLAVHPHFIQLALEVPRYPAPQLGRRVPPRKRPRVASDSRHPIDVEPRRIARLIVSHHQVVPGSELHQPWGGAETAGGELRHRLAGAQHFQ